MKLLDLALSRTSALTVVVLWATVPAWPATTRHVWPDSPAPAPPYADWATAAHVIQDAVDAAEAGDLVLVTNGVYASGGQAVAPATLTNRVAVNKPLQLLGVNGPQATIIEGAKAPGGGDGDGAVRCVYLADGASLSGFTLTNGATRINSSTPMGDERENYGGGAWCASTNAVLTNCVLTGNSAWDGAGAYRGTLNHCTLTGNSARQGGGAAGGTLNNCTLTGNSGCGASGSTLYNCTLTGNSGCGASGSTLYNCTLAGNEATVGGGVIGSTLSNCTLTGNSAVMFGGGAYDSTLNNCVLTGNSAQAGGGADECTLNNCTLTANQAIAGGGAYDSTLNNCVLTGNQAIHGGRYSLFAWAYGGGASDSTLNNCTLTDNSAEDDGGGVYGGTLNNCTLIGNSAVGFWNLWGGEWKWMGGAGGGAYGAVLNNCTLTGNSAREGGGASGGTLNNCTLTGNSAESSGGGASRGTLNNCIVYFNQAATGANYYVGTLNYCCTTPLPDGGQGNFSLDPQLASASHLSEGSPCRGAGSADYATGVDLDGEAWATPPAIGCDEYHAGAATGMLSVSIAAAVTHVVVGYPVRLTGLIEGWPAASAWEFGDGERAANQPYTAHAWSAPGDYAVILRAYNASHPQGVSATVTVRVVAEAVHYVAADSLEPQAPYTSWATAARNLQDAVDVAVTGALVLVTNGVYATGGRAVGTNVLVNRVAVDKPLHLASVNGPEATIIQGAKAPDGANDDGAVRCVYLAGGASLSGFTLTNGAGRTAGDWEREMSGGGAWCASTTAVLTNCVLTGNSAIQGGGVYGGTLNNCTLISNSTVVFWFPFGESLGGAGGGAFGAVLNNCTLTGNSAGRYGGGAFDSTLNNCILYLNVNDSSWPGPRLDNNGGGTLNYCCTTPLPTSGVGNITNAPIFVDLANGNLRLQPNSPCINAGNNAFAPGSTDLDGLPRVVSGMVDMGAYEYQGPGSVISYAWLQRHGLPTNGSADFVDPDTDGLNTWQEWRCLTDPTNALSVLRLLSASPVGPDIQVSWPGVDGVTYFLERSADLGASPPFTLLATNLSGPTGTRTFTDTNVAASPSGFYRVSVRP